MFVFKFTVGLLALVSCAWTEESKENAVVENPSPELSVGELLIRANKDLTPAADEPTLIGDIALSSEKNADPCTARGCMWQKYSDGRIWVPYVIANHFSSREIAIIQRGLDSFTATTCIRFFQRQNERDYLSIESRSGCYSYVGRRGNAQTVSLSRQGCLYHNTVQHELLHALGFNHEQTRSDRDNHICILWENIQDEYKYAFDKIATLNQGTSYDYNSVMQYHRYAFSKNSKPTMEPIPNSNVSFGEGKEMSKNDIDRLNRLYGCYTESPTECYLCRECPTNVFHSAEAGLPNGPFDPEDTGNSWIQVASVQMYSRALLLEKTDL